MRQPIKIVPAVLILLLAWSGASLAHKVTIFAWVEDGMVHTQSKFSGGKKVVNGNVEVLDNQGNLLLEGTTNEKGEFSFKPPAVSDLKIVLNAGMGHGNSWTISADELAGDLPGSDGSQPVPQALEKLNHSASSPAKVQPGETAASLTVTSTLSAEEVESIVSQQLEKKLAPLTRMIAAEQGKGPTLSEIFGGIGYILGLVGLGAYLRYRKEGRR